MTDSSILFEIATPMITAVTSGWAGWFFARKKYDAEVDNQKIENVSRAVAVYQEIIDDLQKRVNDSNQDKRRLEIEVSNLKNQVMDLTMNICLDLSCAHRIKELKKRRRNVEEDK